MERTWLIQRLQKPFGGTGLGLGLDNPFAFGGGLKNGGLSETAMSLIRGIWEFDYMGAAEFEFGAVPEALSKIAEADLEGWSFTIPLKDVAGRWDDKTTHPKGEATIYVLSPGSWREEIERRIRGWAADPYGTDDRDNSLQEITLLNTTLRPYDRWDGRTVGWLELDNGFMFFTDAEMYEKTARLFGIEVTVDIPE
jgi:hypothetical protein